MSRAVVVMSLLTETWRCGRDLAEAEILREDVETRMSMAVMEICASMKTRSLSPTPLKERWRNWEREMVNSGNSTFFREFSMKIFHCIFFF